MAYLAYLSYLSYLVVYYLILSCLSCPSCLFFPSIGLTVCLHSCPVQGRSFIFKLHAIAVQVSWKQFSSLYSWKWDWPTNTCSIGSSCHFQFAAHKIPSPSNAKQLAVSRLNKSSRLAQGYSLDTWSSTNSLASELRCGIQRVFIAIICINQSQAPQVKKYLSAQRRGWATQIGGAGAVTANAVFHLWAGALHDAGWQGPAFTCAKTFVANSDTNAFLIYFKNSRL